MEETIEATEVKVTRIPINIWDDFWEDGYVPEGEIQETYAYVEDDKIPHEGREQFLEAVFEYMNEFLQLQNEGVETEMFFYESAKKYPQWVGTDMEYMLFDRWEIRFKHLTHKRLDKLVEELNEANFEIEGVPFEFYSES
jgi:hypothetical protein